MTIVLDANILIRAVLGRRVRNLLGTHRPTGLVIPEVMIEEARRNPAPLLKKRGDDVNLGFELLEQLLQAVAVDFQDYSVHTAEARARLGIRGSADWPVAAAALALNCPIWTEDRDFFGCGIATWTTDRIDIFFSGATES